MGHEERFLPPRLSAGYGFNNQTLAGKRGKEEDAPGAAVRKPGSERVMSTHNSRSLRLKRSAGVAP
jgi:hypothetical protein